LSARAFAESTVEQAALSWLGTVGWQVRNGAVIAPGEFRVKEAAHGIKETTV